LPISACNTLYGNVYIYSLVTNVVYLPLPYLQYIIFLSFKVSYTPFCTKSVRSLLLDLLLIIAKTAFIVLFSVFENDWL